MSEVDELIIIVIVIFKEENMEFGILSLLPAVLTIILAIITKEVLLSIFVGLITGTLILSGGNPILAIEEFVNLIINGVADPVSIQVLIIIIVLGGLIGIIVKSGGSEAFGKLLMSKVKTRRGAETVTWGIGMMIFFDDPFNCLTNGTVMRPITDKYGVSREKFSYIVDSTAVSICLLCPLSGWVGFMCSLIAEAYKNSGISGFAYKSFLMSIPYNYYCWLSIIMVLMVIFFKLDFGPMAKAEKRTQETGVVCEKTFSGGEADEDDFASIKKADGKAIDLLLPIITLIILAILFMLYTGGFFNGNNIAETVNNMDGLLAITYAVILTVAITIVFFAVKKLSSISESLSAFIIGIKAIVFVVILLAFAWGLGGLCDALDTAGFLVSLFDGNVPAFLTPFIIFVVSCVMTFATGATWGTYAIMIPIAVPLSVAMGVDPIACISAVLGGGAFGNHCSPLADTAIISSAASNIRHTDHIKTQIPYSVTCAVVASVGYLIAGIVDNPIVPILAVLILFVVVMIILHKLFGHNQNTSLKTES